MKNKNYRIFNDMEDVSYQIRQTLAMIANGMDHQEWKVFWDCLGEYIFEDEDQC